MKRVKTRVVDEDMRPEYDFSGAVRGKYLERFQQGKARKRTSLSGRRNTRKR